MIHKLANRLAVLSMESDNRDLASKETYIYGFEILIGKAVTYSILLIIGLIINLLWEMIIFIAFLTFLRGQAGGYHLQTNYGCILYSVLISSFSILVADNIHPQFALTILPTMLILSSICIIIYSPINHPNLNLTEQEIENCKKRSRRFLAVEVLAVTLLLIVRIEPSIIISACLAIISVAISMIMAKIKKQEVLYHG